MLIYIGRNVNINY